MNGVMATDAIAYIAILYGPVSKMGTDDHSHVILVLQRSFMYTGQGYRLKSIMDDH